MQIPLNELMHEDSLQAVEPMKQLKNRNHNVMNTLIGVSRVTNDGLFGSTTAMVYSQIRRYIPYGCRSSTRHIFLKRKMLNTREYKMLLFHTNTYDIFIILGMSGTDSCPCIGSFPCSHHIGEPPTFYDDLFFRLPSS